MSMSGGGLIAFEFPAEDRANRMAHRSRAYGGEIQPWAKGLAVWAFRALVSSRAHAPFVGLFNGIPCVILPRIEPHRIALLVCYGSKRALSIRRLTELSADELCRDWRSLCRGYIVCDLDPSRLPLLQAVDHNCTRNAAYEMLDAYFMTGMPTLAEIDASLGTRLEIAEAKPLEHARRLVDAAKHPTDAAAEL